MSEQHVDPLGEDLPVNSNSTIGITQKSAFVYLLVSDSGATYVGATVDVNRRLRQHNKELVGGAHLTAAKVAKGESWTRQCYVSGFPNWSAALQFEWRWKQLSRKIAPRMKPLDRRMEALHQLLNLERSTTKAIPYCKWVQPPEVHFS